MRDPEDSRSHVGPILQDWQRAISNLDELWCFINLNLGSKFINDFRYYDFSSFMPNVSCESWFCGFPVAVLVISYHHKSSGEVSAGNFLQPGPLTCQAKPFVINESLGENHPKNWGGRSHWCNRDTEDPCFWHFDVLTKCPYPKKQTSLQVPNIFVTSDYLVRNPHDHGNLWVTPRVITHKRSKI